MVTSTLTVPPTLNWPVQEMEATTGTPLLIGGNRAKALRLYSFPERKSVRYVILYELKVADFFESVPCTKALAVQSTRTRQPTCSGRGTNVLPQQSGTIWQPHQCRKQKRTRTRQVKRNNVLLVPTCGRGGTSRGAVAKVRAHCPLRKMMSRMRMTAGETLTTLTKCAYPAPL